MTKSNVVSNRQLSTRDTLLSNLIKAFLKRDIKGHNTLSIWKPNEEKLELRFTVRLTPSPKASVVFPVSETLGGEKTEKKEIIKCRGAKCGKEKGVKEGR